MRNFLILRYDNCGSGICQMVSDLQQSDQINKIVFSWKTQSDYFNSFNIKLLKLNEVYETTEIIFSLILSNKSYETLKSFLVGGKYRFEVRTICGLEFSAVNSVEFEIDKTGSGLGTGLEQNLIG